MATTPMPLLPEQHARERIDAQLMGAGWTVQSQNEVNLHAAQAVAVRDFPLLPGHGRADYMLFVDGKAVGVIEAKEDGTTLAGVEIQTEALLRRPATQVPGIRSTPALPLPFHRHRDVDHQPPRPRTSRPPDAPPSAARRLCSPAAADPVHGDAVSGNPVPGILRRRLRAMSTLETTPNWDSSRLHAYEKNRRKPLATCDLHTVLRLPITV